MDGRLISRRELLQAATSFTGLSALGGSASVERLMRWVTKPVPASGAQSEAGNMIVYSREYVTLEMPASDLNTWITPVDSFFVRNNLLMPTVDPATWSLTVTGEVERPLTFTLQEFLQLRPAKVINTIECAGNGRVNYKPSIGGVPWGRGGVGNGIFEGPPLGDVLRLAKLKPTAKHVAFRGLERRACGIAGFHS